MTREERQRIYNRQIDLLLSGRYQEFLISIGVNNTNASYGMFECVRLGEVPTTLSNIFDLIPIERGVYWDFCEEFTSHPKYWTRKNLEKCMNIQLEREYP